MKRYRTRDEGAAAVEFALMSVPLIMLTFGIIFFGWAFHVQTVLDNAARDAVRHYTLSEPADASANATAAANSALSHAFGSNALGSGAVAFGAGPDPSGACPPQAVITMTLVLQEELPLNGLFGLDLQLEGSGSMQCAN